MIELMIVVVIAALLMLAAFPAYQEQLHKTRRTVAKGELQSLLARQEQFFVNNRQYSTDLSDLGFGGATSYRIDDDGQEVDSGGIYLISLTEAAADAFTITAAPRGAQATDTRCGLLSLTSAGIKASTGTATLRDCW
ncbi:pilus assembly protein [Kineobactrum salinum]|uniref:Pilus assembly protein n=2 Tax=Kineobactrum salinum TaxID=2708301 RepID=A0A6C0U963_9GAMM|nr:pilus assembly protein [Kineobactrum salinum]